MIISSVILLAFFQISIRNATVGMEVGTLKISALGVYVTVTTTVRLT